MSLSVYNTALSDLRCGRILSSTYWTGAVEDIFISQISQWQKWVGRRWKRGWMSEKYEKQQFVFRNLVCDWFSHNGHRPADAECKVLLFSLSYLESSFHLIASFICIFQKGQFRKIHFAQLWLDKHQQVSYVLKVLVLHPSRWPLTLRISLSTPSRTHCTCEGLSCTAWNVTFKYLGKITRILCQRHNSWTKPAFA